MNGSSQQHAPALDLVRRVMRGRRFDRNPLRRVTDRVETVVVTLLVAAFLVAAPLAALAAGGWAHRAAHTAEVAQLASRRQVTATLLAGPLPRAAAPSLAVTWADEAQWVAPDGQLATAILPVAVETRGRPATVPVWSTLTGDLVPPPLNGVRVGWLTVLGGATGLLTAAVALALAGLAARLLLSRHRMAAWAADWRATAPRWSTFT